ncbi:hypothetical protein D3C78_1616950 [compost metagenome]
MQHAVRQFLDADIVHAAARGVVVACAAKAGPGFGRYAGRPIEGGIAFIRLAHFHRGQGPQPFNDPDACAFQAPGAGDFTVQHGLGDGAFRVDDQA